MACCKPSLNLFWPKPLFLVAHLLGFPFCLNFVYDLHFNCVKCTLFVLQFLQKELHELLIKPCALQTSNPFVCQMFNSRCLHLNKYYQLFCGVSHQNVISFVYVISMTFVFIYARVIQKTHFYITKVHTNIITSSSFVSTFASLTFLNLVLPFKWLERKLIGMFHDLFALFNEHDFHPSTSIISSNVSFVHLLVLVVRRDLLPNGGWFFCI